MHSSVKPTTLKLQNSELLFIFLGFIAIITLIISIYVVYNKEQFYPWGPVAYGGPWNIPTRYPIRGWGSDIRGYPAPYPIDYGIYGYPGGQPAYPAPEPDGSNTTLSTNTKSTNQAPFGIEMTTKPTKNNTTENNNPRTSTNDKPAADERAVDEWYEKESKWWPDWVSWPWMPYFNYGLHYDVNGKLKPANNESIVANHTWSWW